MVFINFAYKTRNTIFAVTREARVKDIPFSSAKTGKVTIFEILYNLTHALVDNMDRVSPGPFVLFTCK